MTIREFVRLRFYDPEIRVIAEDMLNQLGDLADKPLTEEEILAFFAGFTTDGDEPAKGDA